MVLKKVSIDNMLSQDNLYSKNIRGDIDFSAEVHIVDNNKMLQIILYRNHPRIQEFIERAKEKNLVTTQRLSRSFEPGVLRLYLNDEKFMINNINVGNLVIEEYNFTSKGINIPEMPKGKLQIKIEITFTEETDNSKIKKELKDYFKEEK